MRQKETDVIRTQLIPAALRLMRQNLRITQTALATRSGMTKAQLSNYELGRTLPTLPNLAAYLSALGKDFADLQIMLNKLGGSQVTPPPLVVDEEVEARKEEDRERMVILAVLRGFRVLLKELGLDRAAGQPAPGERRGIEV
jgi:transcriptional regulator with XRE-family HTH domain